MRGVLLVGPRPPPVGGVATHLRELERTLSAHAVPVRVVDPRHDAPGGDGRPRLLAQLAAATARGDLIHLHTNGHNRMSWTVAALGSAPSSAGRPCVLTLHSGLAPAFIAAHPSLVRAVCARYTFVVAVNAELAAALDRAGVPHARVVVAPAFTSASLAFRLPPPGLQRIRRQHPLLLASAVVAGAHEYGADVLLDAFVHVHQTFDASALLIYGPGTGTPAFADEVRRRGLERAVYLLGELDRERALAVAAASDLFIRPSRADGDAISVREAVALETPVIASDVGCRPVEAHLFSVGDSRNLAEKVFHVVGNRSASVGSRTTSTPDCMPTLLSIYHRCGVLDGAATPGTAFATRVSHVRHRGTGEPKRAGGPGRAVPDDRGDRAPGAR
jgi:glycosyltransferase involved in cell wall biosynthesis